VRPLAGPMLRIGCQLGGRYRTAFFHAIHAGRGAGSRDPMPGAKRCDAGYDLCPGGWTVPTIGLRNSQGVWTRKCRAIDWATRAGAKG
jgi:hypothetical protein